MCYPVQCPDCGKTGWAGCGQHVDTVTGSVPASERCRCRETLVTDERDRAERQPDPGTPCR